MKITLPTSSILKAVDFCRIARHRLNDALMVRAESITPSNLTFESFDGAKCARYSSLEGAEYDESGTFFIPLSILGSWASTLRSDSKVRLDLKDGYVLARSSDPRSNIHIPLLTPDNIPIWEEPKKQTTRNSKVNRDDLYTSLRMGIFSSEENPQEEVTGTVNLWIKGIEVGVAATDKRIAALSRLKAEGESPDDNRYECLIQRRDVRQILSGLPNSEDVWVHISDNSAGFSCHIGQSTALVVCPIINNKPLPLENYFDLSNSPRSWFFLKDTLASAVKRSLIQSKREEDGGRLLFTPITSEEHPATVGILQFLKGEQTVSTEYVEGSRLENPDANPDFIGGAIHLSGNYLGKGVALFGGTTIYVNDGGLNQKKIQSPIILSNAPPQEAKHFFLIMPMAPR